MDSSSSRIVSGSNRDGLEVEVLRGKYIQLFRRILYRAVLRIDGHSEKLPPQRILHRLLSSDALSLAKWWAVRYVTKQNQSHQEIEGRYVAYKSMFKWNFK